MPSKLQLKRKKVLDSGWYWYKCDNKFWALHKNWHWSADHLPFITERDVINNLYDNSFPTRKQELVAIIS